MNEDCPAHSGFDISLSPLPRQAPLAKQTNDTTLQTPNLTDDVPNREPEYPSNLQLASVVLSLSLCVFLVGLVSLTVKISLNDPQITEPGRHDHSNSDSRNHRRIQLDLPDRLVCGCIKDCVLRLTALPGSNFRSLPAQACVPHQHGTI